jgi:hypothetical protein
VRVIHDDLSPLRQTSDRREYFGVEVNGHARQLVPQDRGDGAGRVRSSDQQFDRGGGVEDDQEDLRTFDRIADPADGGRPHARLVSRHWRQ